MSPVARPPRSGTVGDAESNARRPISLLMLEPGLWRYLGLLHVLSGAPGINFLGDKDYNKILTLKKAPPSLKPDVVMLSYSLVVDFGLALLARMKDLFPRANILVHGYEAKIERIADALAAGANGYFLLSHEPEELFEALEIVDKGLICGPPEAVALLIERMRRRKGNAVVAMTGQVVSPYELTILKMLRDGMGNKEIAAKLGVAEVTVKSHLAKLYRRFKVRTRLQLFSYAMEHGLIPTDRPKDRSAS